MTVLRAVKSKANQITEYSGFFLTVSFKFVSGRIEKRGEKSSGIFPVNVSS